MNDVLVGFAFVCNFQKSPVIAETEFVFAVDAKSCFKSEVYIEAVEIIERIIRAEKTDGESGTCICEEVEAVAKSHSCTDVEGNAEVRDVITIIEGHVKQQTWLKVKYIGDVERLHRACVETIVIH